MSAKAPENSNLFHWLYERGEESVSQALEELLGHPGVSDGIAKLAQRAFKTKGRVDKNVEILLHLFNLPSRADFHALRVKIEHLQGSLVNLNMKVDRLLAAQERKKKKT
jgi:hypothetical protein